MRGLKKIVATVAAIALAAALAPSVASANLLTNASFEIDGGSPTSAQDWIFFGSSADIHERSPGMPRTGGFSALIGAGTPTSGFDGVFQKVIGINDGDVYAFDLYAKATILPIISDRPDPIRMRIEWHSDPGGGSSEISRDEIDITAGLSGSYNLFSVSGIAPVGTGHARLVLAHNHSDTAVFADDFSFVPEPASLGLLGLGALGLIRRKR